MMRFFVFFFLLLHSVALSMDVEEIISNHPSVLELQHRLEALKKKEIYVSKLPDPVLSLSITDIQLFYRPFGRSLEPMQAIQFTIFQMYIPDKKRKIKSDTVRFKYSAEYYRLLSKVLDLKYQLYSQFYRLWEVKEKLRLIKQYRKISQDIISLTNTLYSVGKVSQAEVFDAQFFYSQLRQREIILEGMEKEIKSRLGYFSDRLPEIKIVEPFRPEPPDTFVERAEKQSPYIIAIGKEIKEQNSRLLLAREEYTPDFGLSGTYAYRQGFNDYISLGISFNLPFWSKSRIDSKILQQVYLKKSLKEKYRDRLKKIRSQINSSYYRLLSSYSSYSLLKDVVKTQAEAVYESLVSEYQVGEKNIFDLLKSLNQILAVKEKIIEETAVFNINLKNIQRLTGELK
ncbi:TolC family protein [Persephonella sp.]